uniref:helix-turn-helix domain-containing protein n=1 Tax=Stenotrophomonas maltophilia TaxID=40324 RepID=UPI001953C01F
LATLVERGLVVRRDSPNGKRYARRGVSGEVSSAFGIDLNPLIARAGEFAGGAREARRLRGECKELKESISVARRD